MKKSILSIISLLFCLTVFAQDTPKDFTKRSKQILEYLKGQEFGKIVAEFDTSVSARLDSAKLATVWNRMVGKIGSPKSVDSIMPDHQPNYDVVIQRISFEKKQIDFKLVFGTNEKIKGLFFLPVNTKEHYSLPPYYKTNLFAEKQMVIENGEYKLPGILTVPVTAGRHPVVILVHGSGPNDKDESVGPLKPFKDITIGLANQGIAVLRYDKRTRVYGRSMAEKMKAMTVKEETTDDVIAAIEAIKKDSTLDSNRIFLIGHSLGGMLLPRIAKQEPGLKGLVLLAANTRPLEDLFSEQAAYILSLDGLTPKNTETLDSIKKETKKVKQLTAANLKDSVMLLRLPASYWLDLKGYDQVKTAASLKIPLLILQGERDYQVTMIDFNAWKNGLKGKNTVTFRSYPKLNHFFVEGEGKSSPEEYSKAGNVAEYVLDDIAGWIQSGSLK